MAMVLKTDARHIAIQEEAGTSKHVMIHAGNVVSAS